MYPVLYSESREQSSRNSPPEQRFLFCEFSVVACRCSTYAKAKGPEVSRGGGILEIWTPTGSSGSWGRSDHGSEKEGQRMWKAHRRTSVRFQIRTVRAANGQTAVSLGGGRAEAIA